MSARARAEAIWNGSSNSHSEDSYCPPTPRIGVDTISWGWSDPEAVDRLLRLDGLVPKGEDYRPLRILPAPGGAVRVNRRLDGLGTLGAFPAASMLFVEGRARALERADETDHGLGRLHALPDVQGEVVDRLGELLGRGLEAPAALRRADLAGELAFDRGEDGRQLLAILDGLHSPLHKLSVVFERGGPGVQTVYWRTPKRQVPVLRAYDKGVESGTAPAGERIRIERQLRYGSGSRPTVGQWLTRDFAQLYAKPLLSWLRGGVLAGTADQLIRTLTDAVEIWPTYWSAGSCWCSGTGAVHVRMWDARKAERLIGTVAVLSAYGADWSAWSPKQRQRRLREVRELGVLLTSEPVRVDVDAAVGSLCELWKAAA